MRAAPALLLACLAGLTQLAASGYIQQLISELDNAEMGDAEFIASAGDWRYGSNEEDGDEGWDGLCEVGKKQSPVDFPETEEAKKNEDEVEPLAFFHYKEAVSTNLTNNGHTVVLNINQPCDVGVASGGLRSLYFLDQIHFHWNSEHTVNGKRYAMEVHLVHHNVELGSFDKAIKKARGVAVLGAFVTETTHPNPVFNSVIEGMSEARDAGAATVLKSTFSAADLLPKNVANFYRYEGSLTTPPCLETVVWTVFDDTLHASREQIEAFRELQTKEGPMKFNYRPTQPLNDRDVTWISTILPEEEPEHVFAEQNEISAGRPTKSQATVLILSLACIRIILRTLS
nr:PREDICTED: carbonic anhydrase 2-like isoform X1 [Bemisia tabaci]